MTGSRSRTSGAIGFVHRLGVALITALVVAASVPAPTMAAELRQGEDVVVDPGEVINDDL